jgi:O-antigen ligase
MGLYLAILIPFAVALLHVSAVKRGVRTLLLAGILAMTVGVWATNSRGAALFLITALLFLGLHSNYRWILGGLLALIVLAGVRFSFSASPATLQNVLEAARVRTGLSGREMVWRNTFQLLQQAPPFGYGPGNFSREYVAHFGFFVPNNRGERAMQMWTLQTSGEGVDVNFHAHNIYLQLAGELGLLGPLLFLAGLFAVIVHSERRGRRWPARSHRRALVLATAASAVGLAAFGLFDSQLVFTVGSVNQVAGALLAIGLKPGGCYA